MISSLDTSGLSALHAAGETLLFPHSHAARLWRRRLGRQSASSAAEAGPWAWHEWTSQLWSTLLVEGLDDRLLLNRLQEAHLWTGIVAGHLPGATVAPSGLQDLAKLASSALQRAAAFRLVDRVRSSADTADARAFAHWLHLFRERCNRDRLLAPALLDDALAFHLRSRIPGVPETLHLIGFQQLTPSQAHLLDTLSASGIAVRQHTFQQLPGATREAVEFPDAHQQLRFAVRLMAETVNSRPDEGPRVGLICPTVQEYRPELDRLFRELLAPELESVFTDLSSTPWYFSTPPPLRTVPLVADALDLLRWTVSPLPLERIGQLLLSPFVSTRDSSEARARFDVRSHKQVPALRGSLDLAAFTALLPRPKPDGATQASFGELRTLAQTARQAGLVKTQRSADDWTEQIRKLLHAVGWPGSRPLSPLEYQTLQTWEGLLDSLATLQFDGAAVSFSALLDLLSAEAVNIATPAINLDAPVQVLTLAEADALTFDLVVHLDATEENLPRIERRHPLLSQALQRSVGIGDPAQAFQQARRSLESLVHRSGSVFLLAPLDIAEGKSQLTALSTDLYFNYKQPTDVLTPELPREPVAMERLVDPETMPLLTSAEVRGGVDVLRLQAACGFHAFATYRLGADQASPRSLGIDPRESGSLLHKILEILWQQLGSSSALKELSPEQRRATVKQAVEEGFALHRLSPAAGDTWAERYLNILKRRFARLLIRWLEEHEMQRPAFTVLAQEQKQLLTLGPIRLSIRPDRIDEVAGGKVFVDYKTSYDLSSKHWLEERPHAPQLPAYALAADPESIKGIAFAQIRPGEKMGWISLSEPAGPFLNKRNERVHLLTPVSTAPIARFADSIPKLSSSRRRTRTKPSRRKRLAKLLQMPLLFETVLDLEDRETQTPTLLQVPELDVAPVPDAAERNAALDIHHSWIVEAPAGSGKTGLLIQRYLKLLAEGEVEQPGDVLAITFTRKADGEMRRRILEQLSATQAGKSLPARAGAFEITTRQLAAAALARDRALGWRLLENPQQLNIRTIDSFCAELAGSMPLVAGAGGRYSPTDDPGPLYELAAERTLLHMGGKDPVLTEDLEKLLLRRDAQPLDVRRLLADMLRQREQWGELVPLKTEKLTDQALDEEIRPRLDETLQRLIGQELVATADLIGPDLLKRLASLGHSLSSCPGYNGDLSPIALCEGRPQAPTTSAGDLDHWVCLAKLLLTKDGSWRAGMAKNTLRFEASKAEQQQTKDLIGAFQDREQLHPGLRKAIQQLSELPEPDFPEDQWQAVKALCRVLRQALLELQIVFAERHTCDFSEVALTAKALIRSDAGTSDILSTSIGRLKHLLVDEMQDTSAGQYELLEALTASWDGATQTLFLVGDPKQSIYEFRQARVERFRRVMEDRRFGHLTIGPLRLHANFRSQASLVEAFNTTFSQILPALDDASLTPDSVNVPFTPATPTRSAAGRPALYWHAAEEALPNASSASHRGASSDHASPGGYAHEIRSIIETFLYKWPTRPADGGEPCRPPRIAVLARSRSHLASVIQEFHEDRGSGPLPFRAVDIEALS